MLLERLHFDFSVATSWQAEVHQAIDGLWGRADDIDQAFMNTHLERFTALFVNMRALDDRKSAATCR